MDLFSTAWRYAFRVLETSVFKSTVQRGPGFCVLKPAWLAFASAPYSPASIASVFKNVLSLWPRGHLLWLWGIVSAFPHPHALEYALLWNFSCIEYSRRVLCQIMISLLCVFSMCVKHLGGPRVNQCVPRLVGKVSFSQFSPYNQQYSET